MQTGGHGQEEGGGVEGDFPASVVRIDLKSRLHYETKEMEEEQTLRAPQEEWRVGNDSCLPC